MKIWKEYVTSIKEVDGYKNRIKSYVGDRNELLDQGGQDNSPPFTKKMGSHVTFDKQLEEEVEPESFEMRDDLEPRIWKNEKLRWQVRKNLMYIAKDFISKLPVPVKIKDVTLTGSLANYNWSNYSDVDLHIIVDFLEIDENLVLVKSFFDNARMRWNNSHDIKMRGYDVEIYVEDSRETHKSSGIYSIMNDEWIKEPKKFSPTIDFNAARRKADDIEFQVNIMDNLIIAGRYKHALKNIDRLKRKIKNMRRAGLESKKQEYSVENIAFKILRRNGILDLLQQLKTQAYDNMMNLQEKEDGL
tara:strand:- start:372 stop:1277 length:906 start_codon:yes stop_codon:yes gene_type:complete